MRNRYITAIFIFLFITSFTNAALDITYDNNLVPHINIEGIPSTVSGNITTFLELTDTPSTYSGQAGLVATVNPGETGLIFSAVSGGNGSGIINISQAGDVDTSGVVNDDILTWDSSVAKWIDSKLNSILTFGNNFLFFSDNNEISFNETKLNITILDVASVYNNTDLILWEEIGNNITLKNLSKDMVINNGSFETKFRSHQSRAGMEVVNGTVRIGGQWP